MRLVVGSALVVRAGLRLWSDPPPMNVTIPAVLLMGAGILLIVGLWTPIVGTFIALIEIWKMLTASRRQMGLAAVGNHRCRSRNVRPGFMVSRCSPFWVEARRSSSSQKVVLTLLKRPPQRPNFLPQKKAAIRSPRVCDLPRCGAARKRNWADNGSCLNKGVKVREALMWKIATHGFALRGSSNHGCSGNLASPLITAGKS